MAAQRNKSKYAPGSIIYLDEVKDTPDRVTLNKVKTIPVEQDGGLSTVVQISKGMISRQPHATDGNKAYAKEMRRFETTIYPNKPGFKYCTQCAEWVSIKGFSPKSDNRDGLHSHCKECRAEHERLMYWNRKHTAIGKAA